MVDCGGLVLRERGCLKMIKELFLILFCIFNGYVDWSGGPTNAGRRWQGAGRAIACIVYINNYKSRSVEVGTYVFGVHVRYSYMPLQVRAKPISDTRAGSAL